MLPNPFRLAVNTSDSVLRSVVYLSTIAVVSGLLLSFFCSGASTDRKYSGEIIIGNRATTAQYVLVSLIASHRYIPAQRWYGTMSLNHTPAGGRPAASRSHTSGGLGAMSLLAQARYALYEGKTKLAALLAGAAGLATRWNGVAPIVNGTLTLYRLVRRLQ
jgi:hypothetical protein